MSHLFRILYINPQSNFTGAEVTMFDLMENLDADLFQPILLCRDKGPLIDRCAEIGIKTYFLPSLPVSGSHVWHTYSSILFNAYWIANLVKHINIDLIHSNSPRMAYHGGLGARLSGIPSVTHVRDYYHSPFQSSIKSFFLNKVSDRFIAVSNAVRNALSVWAPYISLKTDVVYDGIKDMPSFHFDFQDSIRKELNISKNDILLGIVGAINKLKGQAIAIQAFNEVYKSFPNVFLVVVGGVFDMEAEVYYHQLKNQIDDLGINDRVKFIGHRSNIHSIMSDIDIIIHSPVLPDAFPHVLLEACALKKPIIATNIGGIPEIIKTGETGILFSPGEPTELAKAIIRLINNPSEAMSLGQHASDFVQQYFSMKQYVTKIEMIYKNFLN